MSHKFIGAGFIILGLFALCPAIYEIASGEFFPHAYRRNSWLASMLKIFYGSYAPYMSAWLWILIAVGSIYVGIRTMQPAKKVNEMIGEDTSPYMIGRLRGRPSRSSDSNEGERDV